MILESVAEGIQDVLLTEVPGTAVNVAYLGGAALVIGLGIWGLRVAYQKAFNG